MPCLGAETERQLREEVVDLFLAMHVDRSVFRAGVIALDQTAEHVGDRLCAEADAEHRQKAASGFSEQRGEGLVVRNLLEDRPG